jgi:hypothetical protein
MRVRLKKCTGELKVCIGWFVRGVCEKRCVVCILRWCTVCVMVKCMLYDLFWIWIWIWV